MDKVKVRKEYEWSVTWGFEKKTKFDILDLLFHLLFENCRYSLFDKTHEITTFHTLDSIVLSSCDKSHGYWEKLWRGEVYPLS